MDGERLPGGGSAGKQKICCRDCERRQGWAGHSSTTEMSVPPTKRESRCTTGPTQCGCGMRKSQVAQGGKLGCHRDCGLDVTSACLVTVAFWCQAKAFRCTLATQSMATAAPLVSSQSR